MENRYSKASFLTFLLFILSLSIQAQNSSVYFDLDACNAIVVTGDHMDYSEFTAQVDNSSTCAELEVLGGHLYRNNPAMNKHSCTPGVDGDPAMCISSNPLCTFTPNSDQALRIDLLVSPGSTGSTTLSELSFYEQGPAQYDWINGPSGPNNYPTLFGIRILKNGAQVYLSTNLETQLTWNLRTFDLSGIPEFTVTEPSTFNIELLPYCPVGNGAEVSAWDIDEIRISANCCDTPSGGLLAGGPFVFCTGDSIADNVSGVTLTGATGPNSQWVITNGSNVILSLPATLESVNFDEGAQGPWLIYNISYEAGLAGLDPGNNLLTDLEGCFGLSNSITVTRNQPEGGVLTGGPFEFCVGDGNPDHVSGIVLSGNAGPNTQWVITNELNEILSLPVSLDSVNFDGGGPGICLIWNISYFGTLSGLTPGNNLSEVTGCFDLSNSVTVNRIEPDGGELSGGPFEFCVGDSIPDYVSGVVLTGNEGTSSQWVITNDANVILSLPASLDSVNFDGGGPGICLIWNISYVGSISGLVPGNLLPDSVSGCFDISNPIMVIRNQPEGGQLTGGPFEFCVGDGIPDHVTGVVLTGNTGPNSQWVITNDSNQILSLPVSLDSVNFDGGGQGICLIWNISYFDTLSGLVPGNFLPENLTGCFDLSNSITVIRNQPEGGILTGGPFEFCVGDSIPDFVSGVVLTGNAGPNTQWVITNDSNVILSLPASLDSVNFDGGGPGICLIWNISYFDTLSGLVPGNILPGSVTGCFDLSNSIMVIRNQPDGGLLTGGPFEFCVGDGIPDFVSGITLTGNVGPNSQWVITNSSNMIIGLPASPDSINFEGGLPGTCFIWHVSYYDSLSGLVIGNNLLTDVSGCFDLSNSIMVVRIQIAGGQITGGPFDFCVGDSIPDFVSGINISGNTGTINQWVVTDDAGNILILPVLPDSVNFDLGEPGNWQIWHITFVDSLPGLEVGNNLMTDLAGCFGLSNSIIVIRSQPEGGVLTGGPFEFCVGDSIADLLTGLNLTGDAGPGSQWIITDNANNILNLPDLIDSLNFDEFDPDTYLVWHLSFGDSIPELVVGNNLTNLTGCLSLSNSITVTASQPEGGVLTGGPFEFCVGDSIADLVTGIILTNNSGGTSQWVITDDADNIIMLPVSPDSVDFDLSGPGVFFIWNISYEDTLSELEIGNNIGDLTGCFNLSNSITVVTNQPEGGVLTGGPYEFCVGDTIPDHLTGLNVTGESGENSEYVITDTAFVIQIITDSPDEINFDDSAPGTCLVWHIGYDGTLSGLLEGNSLLTDLDGCFRLSNPITIVKLDCNGIGNGDPVFSLHVSPNPVRDIMTVRMLNKGIEAPLVRLFDATGRLFYSAHHDQENDMEIDMSHLTEGNYFIQVQTAAGYKTQMVLRVR